MYKSEKMVYNIKSDVHSGKGHPQKESTGSCADIPIHRQYTIQPWQLQASGKKKGGICRRNLHFGCLHVRHKLNREYRAMV